MGAMGESTGAGAAILRKVMNEEGGDCDEEEGRSGRSRSGPGRDGTRGRV